MIVLHHLEGSRSHRVLWLLEELGVPYELKRYPRDPKTLLAPAELRRVHPLGKSPLLTDSEAGAETFAESAVILEYLVDTYGDGKFAPRVGTAEHRRYKYWLHYAEGSAMSPLLLKLVFEQIKQKAPWPVRPIAKAIAAKVLHDFVHPQLQLHFDWVESQLGKSTWFAGEELTAADIQMSYPVEAHEARGVRGHRPNTAAWLARVRSRPAYKRAIEKGGPVMLDHT